MAPGWGVKITYMLQDRSAGVAYVARTTREFLGDERDIIENLAGDKLFVVFGVKDLVVVNSEDVVLVADKRRSGNLKKVTEVPRAHRVREASEKQRDEDVCRREGAGVRR